MGLFRITATVKGRVQGVGFRNWTYSQAKLFSLTGWVKNTPEGDLSLLVEGESSQIEEFLTELNNGPRLANVADIELSRSEIAKREYDSFSVDKD